MSRLWALLLLLASAAAAAGAAADWEKKKALANPYVNDLGPDVLDEAVLKSYPQEAREGYRLLRGDDEKRNCQTCHTSARPLNSRFIELDAPNMAEEKKAIAALKISHPEYFADKRVWQIEPGIWRRYVKRMMAKPGCGISNADGKKIWRFLVYDGARRKLGAGAADWRKLRLKLIGDMKSINPVRYEELSRGDDL